MDTKICSKCKKEKPISEYFRYKIKYIQARCKDCNRKHVKEYSKTKEGIITNLYSHHKERSKKRGHLKPEYSKNELRMFLIESLKFNDLFTDWVKSGYIRRLAPSVDRIDDSKGYSFSNIRICTWGENDDKQRAKEMKPVEKYSISGDYLECYVSASEAARRNNTSQSNISRACRENRICKNHKWKYV